MKRLLIGTRNPGKLGEYRLLLASSGFELATPQELGLEADEAEGTTSLEENAVAKAKLYARKGGLLTLAEDSGLFVDALGGAPGVLSARFGASDRERIDRLLGDLKGIPREERGARFVCVIALAEPGKPLGVFRGEVAGEIAGGPTGSSGFGYDPVFFLRGLGKTMAELSPEEKNRISHRGQAARKALMVLRGLLTGA
ncbi:MAG: RdgB/HAM1 family non-canonical purine NTP pyrophosphatase [Chloroflexi bacterium]|nr:RdgB/HAM1 family non-canonical purine NTP pyrophosphatase [Chloroflexota bacterium]